jgi:uncharacterized protein
MSKSERSTRPSSLEAWERIFRDYLAESVTADAAHDPEHIRRVVANARPLTTAEGANWAVVCPAAWLHDCVVVPKNSSQRSQASRLAAEHAIALLRGWGYPAEHFDAIAHAIAAHSFSANITPETLEAKVVQDADRLDAIGAVGIARCLMLGGVMGLPLYDPADPFCRQRSPDDSRFVIDHFYRKLLRLADTMQTNAGRIEARRRTDVLVAFLRELEAELPQS